jgi:hypothetical protein
MQSRIPEKERQKRAGGTRLHWEYAALAIPTLVTPALDDIGVSDPKLRQVARRFALTHLKKVEKALGPMTMRELQHVLAYFVEAYEQRLKHTKGGERDS